MTQKDKKLNLIQKLLQIEDDDILNKIEKLLAQAKRKEPTSDKFSDFQKLLQNGPVMNDEEYNDFIEKKKHFEGWK